MNAKSVRTVGISVAVGAGLVWSNVQGDNNPQANAVFKGINDAWDATGTRAWQSVGSHRTSSSAKPVNAPAGTNGKVAFVDAPIATPALSRALVL